MALCFFRLRGCSRVLAIGSRHSLLLSSTLATNSGDINEEVRSESVDDSKDLTSLRDVSRMQKRYRDRMLHVLKPPEAPDYYTELHTSKSSKKRLYGHFGKASGVDPGRLWLSAEELKEAVEFEQEWEPSLQERWQKLKETHVQETAEMQKKRETVESQMSKMPQLIQQFRARLAKAEEQEQQLDQKRKALLNEAREYFGYDIDPRDPRFEQMKEKKEAEEKLLKKKKRKEEKMARFMASLK